MHASPASEGKEPESQRLQRVVLGGFTVPALSGNFSGVHRWIHRSKHCRVVSSWRYRVCSGSERLTSAWARPVGHATQGEWSLCAWKPAAQKQLVREELPAGDHLLPAGSCSNEQSLHGSEPFEYLPSTHKRQVVPRMSGTEPGLQVMHDVLLTLGWYWLGKHG